MARNALNYTERSKLEAAIRYHLPDLQKLRNNDERADFLAGATGLVLTGANVARLADQLGLSLKAPKAQPSTPLDEAIMASLRAENSQLYDKVESLKGEVTRANAERTRILGLATQYASVLFELAEQLDDLGVNRDLTPS